MTTLVASVVVPVRGRCDDLKRCLARLILQRDVDDFEILVCDDGSNEADSERIKDAASTDPRIRYLRQPPRGPAAARNLGVACALAPLGEFRFAPHAVVLHPWRKMTLQSSLRRMRHLDWLLVTALRHGCLGWSDRP